jgi:hypothetical protein
MKVVNGVVQHDSWESAIAFFSQPNAAKPSQSSTHAFYLAKQLADSIHVTLAILADNTLDCDYKLGRLITPKELKHSKQILDMLVTELCKTLPPTSNTLVSAQCLQGALAHLTSIQRIVILKTRTRRADRTFTLHGIKHNILNNITTVLNAIR